MMITAVLAASAILSVHDNGLSERSGEKKKKSLRRQEEKGRMMKLTKFKNSSQTSRIWKNSFDAQALLGPPRQIQYRSRDERYLH